MPTPMNSKLIDLKTKQELFPDKVPLEAFRKIWNDKEKQYSDQNLEQIRGWLYAMAEVIVRVSDKVKQQTKVIPIGTTHENEKSNYLCPGEHRRAS